MLPTTSRPCRIQCSTSRRDATPARASTFCMRSPTRAPVKPAFLTGLLLWQRLRPAQKFGLGVSLGIGLGKFQRRVEVIQVLDLR